MKNTYFNAGKKTNFHYFQFNNQALKTEKEFLQKHEIHQEQFKKQD
jgi:hypothetical protein